MRDLFLMLLIWFYVAVEKALAWVFPLDA